MGKKPLGIDVLTAARQRIARDNRLYDLMHQAGLTIHQQRICQPYGDDQRKGWNNV